jgi:hypothetical protein
MLYTGLVFTMKVSGGLSEEELKLKDLGIEVEEQEDKLLQEETKIQFNLEDVARISESKIEIDDDLVEVTLVEFYDGMRLPVLEDFEVLADLKQKSLSAQKLREIGQLDE